MVNDLCLLTLGASWCMCMRLIVVCVCVCVCVYSLQISSYVAERLAPWCFHLVSFYDFAIPISPKHGMFSVHLYLPFFYAVSCKRRKWIWSSIHYAHYIIPRCVVYARCTNGVHLVVRLTEP